MQKAASNTLAQDAKMHASLSEKLDEALLETFPASDPIAISCEGPAQNTKPKAKGVPNHSIKKQ